MNKNLFKEAMLSNNHNLTFVMKMNYTIKPIIIQALEKGYDKCIIENIIKDHLDKLIMLYKNDVDSHIRPFPRHVEQLSKLKCLRLYISKGLDYYINKLTIEYSMFNK